MEEKEWCWQENEGGIGETEGVEERIGKGLRPRPYLLSSLAICFVGYSNLIQCLLCALSHAYAQGRGSRLPIDDCLC